MGIYRRLFWVIVLALWAERRPAVAAEPGEQAHAGPSVMRDLGDRLYRGDGINRNQDLAVEW